MTAGSGTNVSYLSERQQRLTALLAYIHMKERGLTSCQTLEALGITCQQVDAYLTRRAGGGGRRERERPSL